MIVGVGTVRRDRRQTPKTNSNVFLLKAPECRNVLQLDKSPDFSHCGLRPEEMLAEMIGTTRSRVSFFMNKFRKLGFIDYKGSSGGLEVHSSLLNVVLHETPGIQGSNGS